MIYLSHHITEKNFPLLKKFGHSELLELYTQLNELGTAINNYKVLNSDDELLIATLHNTLQHLIYSRLALGMGLYKAEKFYKDNAVKSLNQFPGNAKQSKTKSKSKKS